MERINVSLPETLRSQLEAASAASGKSVAEELRSRAAWGLSLEPMDAPTRQLIEDIAYMAWRNERETGTPWHAHAGSHLALRQAILAWFARRKPEGDLTFGPRPHRTEETDDPEAIGMWAEYDAFIHSDWTLKGRRLARLEMEKAWQEIVKLHEQRKQEGGGND
jgi:hypothetical protein